MLKNCESKYEDRMECIHCGWQYKNPNVKRNCPSSRPIIEAPAFLTKVTNFGRAVTKDVITGMKRCTEEEMDQRVEICKGCEFYNEAGQECLKCGCPMNRKRIYRNKVYWKSGKCPIGKWPDLKIEQKPASPD